MSEKIVAQMHRAMRVALNRWLAQGGLDPEKRYEVRQDHESGHCALFELRSRTETSTRMRYDEDGKELGEEEYEAEVWEPHGAPVICLAGLLRHAEVRQGKDPAAEASKRAAAELARKPFKTLDDSAAISALTKITRE